MAEIKRSLAIIIGINQYVNGIPALKTAVNDVRKIAHTLETKYQYQVLQLLDEDATGTQIRELFAAFEQQTLPLPDGNKTQLHPDDRLLFYFAGHGIALDALDNADGPVGFLVPQDARIDNDSSLLPMKRLHDALLALPCRHLLVILDCCFAGAFRWAGQRDAVRAQKMYRERYERFISGCAQQVITSAADDEKAADSLYRFGQRSEHEGHSPFAELLLKGLSGGADYSCDGAITATELYVYIHGELGKTSAKQTPGFSQLKRHDKGEYIFPIPGFKANKLEEAPKLDEKANPYKGLESFEESDSDKFFGRKALIERLQEFVANQPLTVVLGASGSGKSSLVKAGLIPQLKKEREQWRVLDPIRPGESPFGALNHALEREKLPVFAIPNKPTDDLTSGDASKEGNSSDNTLWYEQGLQNLSFNLVAWRKLYPNSKLLLVIDQSEELVTLSRDEVEREMFLKGLARALTAFPDWLRIVLTLRSDFEPQFRETALDPYWSGARFIVPAMTREELREAIVEPSTAKVMYFEPPKLVDDLIDEVVQMPGALPLLSFTLSELYLKYIKSVREGKRNNRAITQEDYEQLGGVARSLTQRADYEYEELKKRDSAYERTVRHVMLRMVAVGGGELARRRVLCTELEYPQPENARVKEVIERFVAARLLVKGRDIENHEYVEPAHDVLVRGWQKLLSWKQQEQENLILQRRLTPAALEWKYQKPTTFHWTTNPHDLWKQLWQRKQKAEFLWNTDPHLDLLKQVLNSPDNWFNHIENEFVQRSLQRQRNNRRFRFSVVATGFAVLLGFAFIQWNQNQQAQIRSLAASSETLFASDLPLEALIAGLKGVKKLEWVVRAEADDTKIRAVTALQHVIYGVREHNRLEGHRGSVYSLAWSPDGKTLASASGDKAIKVWSVDGKVLRTLLEHSDSVRSVTWSPDGKTLASASWDSTIKLWSFDGKVLRTLLGHKEKVNSVAWSPDGKTLASASKDRRIKLWSFDGKVIRTLPGHENTVNSVAWSPDGKTLASASWDNTIKLWSFDGKVLTTIKEHRVTSVSFSPDGKTLASANRDNTIKLWSFDGKELATLKGHSDWVNSVAWNSNGQSLASGSNDKTIKLWSLDNQELKTLKGHEEKINSVAWSIDGKTLASASDDKTIKLWSFDGKERKMPKKQKHEHLITNISFSPDGKTLASASLDKSIKLWSFHGKVLRTIETGHPYIINSVAWSPDGKTIASGSGDKTIKLWSFDGKELTRLKGHIATVNSVDWNPAGKTIASGSDDKTIKLWSFDGKELATLKGHIAAVNSVAWNPDGKTIASGSDDRTIKLWSFDGKELATLKGHIAAVNSVAWSPDGKTIASGSDDKTIKLWSFDGKELATLKGHIAAVNSVAWNPDGKAIASASSDQTALLWNLELLDLDVLLRRGCDWVHDYLKTNPNVIKKDRYLCDRIPASRSQM